MALPDQALEVELSRGEGGAGTVLATGEPLLIDYYDAWDRRATSWPKGLTGPTLLVPVRRGDSILDVLAVGKKPGQAPFTEQDAELLSLFAHQAAIAITNAQLYERVRRSADQFAKLYETSLDIASALDVDELLEVILERATELLSARSANLRMYAGDRDRLVPILPYRQYGPLAQIELAPGEGISGQAFMEREPVVVDDHDQWAGRSDQYPMGLLARVMAVPMIQGEEVTGVLSVDRTVHKPPFNDNDIRLLKLFANQAVLAISNAELYEQAQRRSREIALIHSTSLDVTSRLDLKEVLEAVLERTTDLVQAQQGEVVVYDEVDNTIVDFLNTGLPELGLPTDLHTAGEPPSGLDGIVIHERRPVRIEDYDLWPNRLPEMPIGLIGPMIGVPIQYQGRVLGSLSLARGGGDRPFTDEDERRLVLFANQAAVAIQNARQIEELQWLHEERLASERLKAQLQTAQAVQTGLLPKEPPIIAGWDLAVSWKPALQIGGDFYDFIPLGGSRWGIVIGDVADKGIPAAVYMSVALSTVRSLASADRSPSSLLQSVNRELLRGSNSGSFVSVICGLLHAGGSTITLSTAGHNPPLIRRANAGRVESMQPSGMVLGVESDLDINQAQLDLSPGDVAVLYTDGVTEAMSPNGEPFGLQRLMSLLRADLPYSARGISEAIDQSVSEHASSAEQSDDITHLVLRAAG